MVENENSIKLFLSSTTMIFAVLSLIIVLIYSIISWGQVGVKGADGAIGQKGPQGPQGPPNSNKVISCLEKTNSEISISPSVFPKDFNNKNTVFFDVNVIGKSEASSSSFEVIVVCDGVQKKFLNNNKLLITFQNTISFMNIRATKGLVKNSLVVSTLQPNNYTNAASSVSKAEEQLIALDVDFNRPIWLSFQGVGSNSTTIFARILTIPVRRGLDSAD